MNESESKSQPFRTTLATIAELDFSELSSLEPETSIDVQMETRSALESPIDFPPLNAALIPGDVIAIALDANVPSLASVLEAVCEFFHTSEAGEIHIIVSGEINPLVLSQLQEQLPIKATLTVHQTLRRESFRYLGPDAEGEAVYLNRWLVDADLVLPVVTSRPVNEHQTGDLTGIYPAFADSTARHRHYQRSKQTSHSSHSTDDAELTTGSDPIAGTPEEPAWLLGVQLALCVTPNQSGEAAEIICGTIDALKKRKHPLLLGRNVDSPPTQPPRTTSTSDLVVVSLDGGQSQQSWINVARAAEAGTNHTTLGGTIVVWSSLQEPSHPTQAINIGASDTEQSEPEEKPSDTKEDEDFLAWDESIMALERLEKVSEDYQIILHSKLPADQLEAVGLGCIESVEELKRLAMAFPTRAILRAAQYCVPSE